jgi:adenylate cyclase
LGAVRRQNVAVLFADIVGFTRKAEGMMPEAVVTLLQQFYERMTARIVACGGSVEKYTAANARRCAERMIATLDVGNGERKRQGEMPLAFGIGLNCGPAVVGDVGSEQSLSVTVIGDTVNTASRPQRLTRSLNTPLVAAEAIISAISAAPSPDATELLGALCEQG